MQQFEELYRENYGRIYAFLYHMCSDSSTAEELAQETFFQAYISLHRFNGKSGIYTWLAAIAKHVYFKHLRKSKNALDEIALDPVIETMASDDCDLPDTKLERESVQAAVREVIKKLPQKYKEVVMLRIYAEMSFAQVAQTLGISENSAKVIFCRAKKTLAEELKEYK